VFFDAIRPRADGAAVTDQIWVYDFRSGRHFAATQNPLLRSDLDDFVECYGQGRPRAQRSATSIFNPVTYAQLEAQDFNLDILWPDERAPVGTRSPKEIAREIVDELSVAVDEFAALAEELPDGPHLLSDAEV
jgi:type I restriction enzyme M protein